MNWENLLKGNCPECNIELVPTSISRGVACEACNFSMLQWEFSAFVTGLQRGYHKPGYRVKFGDDVMVLGWIQQPETARLRFWPLEEEKTLA